MNKNNFEVTSIDMEKMNVADKNKII